MFDQKTLAGLHIVEFAHYVPTPLASYWMQQLGARVTRVEHPIRKDPLLTDLTLDVTGGDLYATLNSEKSRHSCDLRSEEDRKDLWALLQSADVFIHQIRPGRLHEAGFGRETLERKLPALITVEVAAGRARQDEDPRKAKHDLNIAAELGLLALTAEGNGAPVLPHTLLADLAGATYPIMMNVAYALFQRSRTGKGGYLELTMRDGLVPFMLWPVLQCSDANAEHRSFPYWGASPRYNIYQTSDGHWLAVAAVEDHFWTRFLDLLSVAPGSLPSDPKQQIDHIAQALRQSGPSVVKALSEADICCTVIPDLAESIEAFRPAFSTGQAGKVDRIPSPLAVGG